MDWEWSASGPCPPCCRQLHVPTSLYRRDPAARAAGHAANLMRSRSVGGSSDRVAPSAVSAGVSGSVLPAPDGGGGLRLVVVGLTRQPARLRVVTLQWWTTCGTVRCAPVRECGEDAQHLGLRSARQDFASAYAGLGRAVLRATRSRCGGRGQLPSGRAPTRTGAGRVDCNGRPRTTASDRAVCGCSPAPRRPAASGVAVTVSGPAVGADLHRGAQRHREPVAGVRCRVIPWL
jgi:hypothetical protein